MNRDEIIRMALEAGGRQANYHELYDHLLMSTDALERFFLAAAAAGAEAEREACAKLCDEIDDGREDLSAKCAEAIRARGEK